MTLVVAILLLVAIAFYLFYALQRRPLQGGQRKPLGEFWENGRSDVEFAEEYAFSIPKTDPEPQIELDFLPLSYGIDRLVLMVKDPNWLYAYWEITDHLKESFAERTNACAWSDSQPVLRLYNLTRGDHFDIEINDDADSWYILIGKPNSRFQAEIGRVYQGVYHNLIASNQVTSPAGTLSEEIDPSWLPCQKIWESLAGKIYHGRYYNLLSAGQMSLPVCGSNHLIRQEQ